MARGRISSFFFRTFSCEMLRVIWVKSANFTFSVRVFPSKPLLAMRSSSSSTVWYSSIITAVFR
ncbi:Uncharacterised protein [Segatella copri]|nr:Uncharacterised protein [Segatella copri]